ncbi:hypothetical protein D7X33_09130 [Butyricicoccus sp. 1XD8-22]|nr:hypothetical protein D7X33_09130 [Butyricicoccus sp. 1XD8-22]
MAYKPEEIRKRYMKMRKRVRRLRLASMGCLAGALAVACVRGPSQRPGAWGLVLFAAAAVCFFVASLSERCPVCGTAFRFAHRPISLYRRAGPGVCPSCRVNLETGEREGCSGQPQG